MIHTVPLNCSLSSFLVEPKSRRASTICCSGSRNYAQIPKLEPFSRNMIDRAIEEPPVIQKTQNQIADYCVTLEGDECCNCWQAYFELKELEKVAPKKEIEKLIYDAGGVKTLISWIPGIASIYKSKKKHHDLQKRTKPENTEVRSCPIPDGLPKTQEELEEEERDRMPDSPFTRLLRARGRSPAWYTLPPDHETD